MVIDNKYGSCFAPHKVGRVNNLDAICFARGYDRNCVYKGYIHETLFICYKEPEKDNYCFLSPEDTYSYISEVCELLGCKIFTFIEGEFYLKVQFAIPDNIRYYKFVNTIIRYCYEYPFAFLCYCAFKNRDLFPKLNIIQIVQLYISTLNNISLNHALLRDGITFSNASIKGYFNMMKESFNNVNSRATVNVSTNLSRFTNYFNVFNTKTMPYISELISNKIKEVYDKYEKNICCWGF